MGNITNNTVVKTKYISILVSMLLTIVVFATLLPTFHLGVRKVIHANQLAILASNRAQLITFTFTPQQYEKLSIDNNELEYNNKMYDIKSSVTTNTNTILTLLPDSRETYVIALFKHLTSRNKVQLTACNLFLFYYYEGIPVIQLKPIITTRISRNYIAHVYFYVNPLHKNTTPPPQLLS